MAERPSSLAILPDCPEACAIIDRATTTAERLAHEVQHARDTWAVLQGLQRKRDSNARFDQDLKGHFPFGLRKICDALFAETVMSLLRATDDPGQPGDRLTLCQLSGILGNETVTAALNDERWIRRNGSLTEVGLIDTQRCEQEAAIMRFKAVVPNGWKKGDYADDERLTKMRCQLRPLRGSQLAHLTTESVVPPNGSVVTSGIDLIAGLVDDANLIFGFGSTVQEGIEASIQRAGRVWDPFESETMSRLEAERRATEYLDLPSPDSGPSQ